MNLWRIAALVGGLVIAGESNAMEIQSTKLDNGMNVVVVPDHRAPVVVHSVWYTVGSMDEETGHTGLSHMLEHMMFKGTDKYPYQAMDKLVQRNGGQQNAFTSRDMTAYHQTIVKDKLPLMMDLEADRMRGLKITEALLKPEKDVVLEERRMRTDSKPQSRFFEELIKVHYPSHTYGNPVIGWEGDIQAYSLPPMLAWYRKHYAPNNATLLVVGDVTLESVLPEAQKTYGTVAAQADVPSRTVAVEPARMAPLVHTKVDGDVQVPVYYKIFRAPSLFQGVAGAKPVVADVVALRVLAEILGGGDAARLYQSLVVNQHLADAASADMDMISAAESSMDIFVSPKVETPLDTIESAVNAEIEKLKTTAVDEGELRRAKASIMADVIYAQDDNDTLMYQVGSWMLAGGKPQEFTMWHDALRAVTAADVQRVAQAYLVPNGSTLGVLVNNIKQLGALSSTVAK
ncbi:MAG: pitrilysin family protein [Alphaproteobacteria bacterium]